MNIVAYGGGVNSTAMVVELLRRGEPFETVIFADTGGEKPQTYAYVETFERWLGERGKTLVRVAHKETLEAFCLRLGTLPSVVIGNRTCSVKFKIEPLDRWMSRWPPAVDAWARGERITKLMGFDAGEPHRAKRFEDERYVARYPLIEWDFARRECLDAIRAAGLPAPPKSSCFFCPNMREAEIVRLRDENPELFERALAMERNNSKLSTVRGLAREHSWAQVADFYDRQGALCFPVVGGDAPCGCYDGEPEPEEEER